MTIPVQCMALESTGDELEIKISVLLFLPKILKVWIIEGFVQIETDYNIDSQFY